MPKESTFRKRLFSKQREEIQNNARIRKEIYSLKGHLKALEAVYNRNWNIRVKIQVQRLHTHYKDPINQYLNPPGYTIPSMDNLEHSPFPLCKGFDGTGEEHISYLIKSRNKLIAMMQIDGYPIGRYAAIMRNEKLRHLID